MNSTTLLEAFDIADHFICDIDWWLCLKVRCGEDAVRKLLLSIDGMPSRTVCEAADALAKIAELMRGQGLPAHAEAVSNAASELKRACEVTAPGAQLA